jgi:hypothetical protein
MEPYYNNTIDKICDDYHQAKSHGLGSDNLSEVATAAVTGKLIRRLKPNSKFRG